MKKMLLAAALFLLYQGLGTAQGFRFGVQASPGLSWMTTADKKLEGSGTNIGIKLGLLGEFYFTPKYAITTGLGFGFNQGGTLQTSYSQANLWDNSTLSNPSFSVVGPEAKLHYRLRYVEIPIGLKLRGGSTEDSPLKFYAEIPVFTLGFLTDAKGDIRGTQNQNTEDEGIRDDVNGLALSYGLGAGGEYEFSSNATLIAGLAYQQQFTDATGKGQVEKVVGEGLSEYKSKGTIGTLSLRIAFFF